ncbi:MAG: hypothetical protein ACLFTQ_02175 [Candidatus Aenigmatarchaeota archaeon]
MVGKGTTPILNKFIEDPSIKPSDLKKSTPHWIEEQIEAGCPNPSNPFQENESEERDYCSDIDRYAEDPNLEEKYFPILRKIYTYSGQKEINHFLE